MIFDNITGTTKGSYTGTAVEQVKRVCHYEGVMCEYATDMGYCKMTGCVKRTFSDEVVHKPDYSYEADMVRRIKEAQSIEAAPRWVPIEEQLPENGFDDVVLVSIGYDVEFGRCNSNGEWLIWSNSEWVQCDKVLAWMPLPEPYRKDDEE